MLFNGINFNFGKVNVAVTSVDTEKATGYLTIKVPIKDMELQIEVKRWIGWGGDTQVNVHFDLRGPRLPEPASDPQDEDYESEDDEDNEEESA